MAASYLTTNTLIESVIRRASIPKGQQTFLDADFLAFANEEIQMGLVPLILSVNEEYYVTPVEVSLVANTSNYAIPERAIGSKLRDVYYRDTSGNLIEMTRISPDDRSYFQASNITSFYEAYYVQGNEIILVPDVGASPVGKLVFTYYMRPSQLVDEDRIATISSISVGSTTTVFTVDLVNSDMSTSSALDIVQAKPGHRIRAIDLIPTAVDNGLLTITFNNSDLPVGIEVGDHIAIANECKIPQIPTDLHSLLAERVAARCLEALGDAAGLQAANQKLSEMEQKSTAIIDNRVEGSPMKIRNSHGLLRSSRIRRRFY